MIGRIQARYPWLGHALCVGFVVIPFCYVFAGERGAYLGIVISIMAGMLVARSERSAP